MMDLQIKMPDPRPCMVRQDGRALLHGFHVHTWTHGAAATIGGFPAGQESTYALRWPIAIGCAIALLCIAA